MSSLEQIEALELKLNSVDLTDDNNLKPLEIIKKRKCSAKNNSMYLPMHARS